jgi:hypothetical protein
MIVLEPSMVKGRIVQPTKLLVLLRKIIIVQGRVYSRYGLVAIIF